jgi:hypothetical protein
MDVEENDARAVLGVAANPTEIEIEAAYRRRADEVRKRFDAAKENSTRMKCRRERAAIEEARTTLLRTLEEQKRLAAEQRERDEQERLATEKRQRDEQERLAAEQRQRDEQERLAAEKRQRDEQERLTAEQRQRDEQERLAAEKRQRDEQERLAAEQRQRDEQERLAAEQRQRDEQERLAAEKRQRDEQERLAAEKRQRDEQERLAAEKRQRDEQERLAAEKPQRDEQERLAAEKRQRDEQERLATEKRQRDEQERFAAEKRQRDEQERLATEKRQRDEQERLAAEKRQRGARKWSKQTIWLLFGGVILVLACAFAGVYYFLHWQKANSLGKLVLNTYPAYANVSIDGVSQGTTPLSLDRIVPGEKHLRIELEGYQDEQLIVVIKPGDQRFLPTVTLIAKKEPSPTATPINVTPTVTPGPTFRPHLVTPTVTPTITPLQVSPTVSPPPVTPTATPVPTSPSITPTQGTYPGEKYPQTRDRVLAETEVASLDYAELRYAINEMYARHGAQFLKEPEVRKQFEAFSWYYPIPGITLAQIDAEFSRIESQNRDLLARLRDQKRPRR